MVREVGAQGPGAVITLRSRELAAADDANRLIHTSWVPRQPPGMTVRSRPELTVVDSGLACDTFRVVGAARLNAAQARGHAQEVVDYFARVERPFSWWVGPTDQPADLDRYLRDAGLEPAETSWPWPRRSTAWAAATLSPKGSVSSGRPTSSGCSTSPASTPPIGPRPTSWSCGSTSWPRRSCCSPARVSGCTAMARRPLVDARRRGVETAILQAAPDGVGIYRRLGFEAYGQIAEFKPR